MAIDFDWHDNDQTIMRINIHHDTSWQEYDEVIDQVAEKLSKLPHRTDLIIFAGTNNMPPGNPMPHIKMTALKLSALPNFGKIVSVSDNSPNAFAKMIVPFVYRILGIDPRVMGEFPTSIEQAEAYIAKMRDTAATR